MPPPLAAMVARAAIATVAVVGAGLGALALLAYHLWSPRLLLAGLALEAAFCVYFWTTHVAMHVTARQHAPADYDAEAVVAAFLRHMDHVDDFGAFLSAWFLDAPVSSIREQNVRELASYALFYRTPEQVQADGLGPQLDGLVQAMQGRHGVRFEPGYNPNLKFMSHLWDEVPHIYRPLVFYAVMEALEHLAWLMLAVNGFQRRALGRTTYYTFALGRPPGSSGEPMACPPGSSGEPSSGAAGDQAAPLLLLHGVGAGLLPYLGVVFKLAAAGQPLLLPVWKHVSMRLTRRIPTVCEARDTCLAMLSRHGIPRAHLFGHSYGTMIAARIVKSVPETVASLSLVDPVCLAMYMPALVKYFLYSRHVCGDLLADGLIFLLSSELHCAANFSRNFFWTSINLWEEHLVPDRTLVVLSGADILCPTLHVRRWLAAHTRVRVLFNPAVAHGAGLLINQAWQDEVLRSILALVRGAGSSAAGKPQQQPPQQQQQPAQRQQLLERDATRPQGAGCDQRAREGGCDSGDEVGWVSVKRGLQRQPQHSAAVPAGAASTGLAKC